MSEFVVGVSGGACHLVVESAFLVVAAETGRVKAFCSCQTELDMAFKFLWAAERHWQQGSHRLEIGGSDKPPQGLSAECLRALFQFKP